MSTEQQARDFTVGVFAHQGKRKVRYMAYTRDYNPQWPGCCEHIVQAMDGSQAKELAILAHRHEQYRIASGIALDSDKQEVVTQ